jgi:hypothetical protein
MEADAVERQLEASMREEWEREEKTDEDVTDDCEMDDVLL